MAFDALLLPVLELVAAGVFVAAYSWWHYGEPDSRESLATTIGAFAVFVGALCHLFYVMGGLGIKLKLAIDNSADCLPLSNRAWADGGNKPRRFVRIKLYNRSKGVAQNTAIRLMSISDYHIGGATRLDYPNPHFLRWNGEGRPKQYQKKTMPHGGPQYADVLFTEASDGRVRVVLADEHYTSVRLEVGHTYQFVVQAVADGATSATKRFYVNIGMAYDAIAIYRFGWVARASRAWNGGNEIGKT